MIDAILFDLDETLLDRTTSLRAFLADQHGRHAASHRAFDRAEDMLGAVLAKARFWDGIKDRAINDRQRRVLNRLLDGFEGKLTSSQWAKLTKSSQDTAARDIDDLIRKGILVKGEAGGRSTSYDLVTEVAAGESRMGESP